MRVFSGIAELIGNTPIIKLNNFCATQKLCANIFAKIESFNPGGSIKDRVALTMLDQAEKQGLLKDGTTIIEPTSGNTGIGLAALCAARKIRLIIVMPDSMSDERKKLIAAYGAELIQTPGAEGMAGAISVAEELHKKINNSFIAGQFTNPANPLAHKLTTAPEIWDAMDGKIDIFVAGAGTGGTVSGTGEFLKEKNKSIKVFAAEPLESAVLSGNKKGAHGIQGIGAGFVPSIYNEKVIDGVITVATAEAIAYAKAFPTIEGLLIGISGGCNLVAAARLAAMPEYAGKNIVTVFPDSGERYLSTELFSKI